MRTIEGPGERQKAEQIPLSLVGTAGVQVGTTEGWGGEQKSGIEGRKLRGCRILGRMTIGWGDGWVGNDRRMGHVEDSKKRAGGSRKGCTVRRAGGS